MLEDRADVCRLARLGKVLVPFFSRTPGAAEQSRAAEMISSRGIMGMLW